MKKNITKTLICMLICICLIAALPFYAFCSDEPLPNESSDTSSADVTAVEDIANDEDTGYDEDKSAEDTPQENVFAQIYSTLLANCSDILSALAFIGSIIIMICYKKGLLPFIKEALAALASGVKTIGEKTENLGEGNERALSALSEELCRLEALAEKLDSGMTDISTLKEEHDMAAAERERLRSVLLTEVEMLYEIFNSATLPQYLKERVGEKVCAMKKVIEGCESDCEKSN